MFTWASISCTLLPFNFRMIWGVVSEYIFDIYSNLSQVLPGFLALHMSWWWHLDDMKFTWRNVSSWVEVDVTNHTWWRQQCKVRRRCRTPTCGADCFQKQSAASLFWMQPPHETGSWHPFTHPAQRFLVIYKPYIYHHFPSTFHNVPKFRPPAPKSVNQTPNLTQYRVKLTQHRPDIRS